MYLHIMCCHVFIYYRLLLDWQSDLLKSYYL
jgi:hypothetical protein